MALVLYKIKRMLKIIIYHRDTHATGAAEPVSANVNPSTVALLTEACPFSILLLSRRVSNFSIQIFICLMVLLAAKFLIFIVFTQFWIFFNLSVHFFLSKFVFTAKIMLTDNFLIYLCH